jgi:hypothetical protein
MLFAAGCRTNFLTPGAGAAGPDDQCPDQQTSADAPAEAGTGGAQAIADNATSIRTDANEIARTSRSQRRNALAISTVARQIAADATRLATAEAPADGAAADQNVAQQRGGSVEDTAARMADGARFIAGRATRIADQSNNARVDELAAGIGTKAQTIVTDAEALGGGTEPAETTTTAPTETTAPAEDCTEETTTTAGGGGDTTTTAAGGETTTTVGGGDTTTTAPPTTLTPIDNQQCDPNGLEAFNGVQLKTDGQAACNSGIMGVVPGAGKIPAVIILEPKNNATLPVGQTTTCTIKFRNWQGGLFDDPATQFGVRPFSLAPDPADPSKQVPIGHSHCYVQKLEGDEIPAEKLDSFVALNSPSEDNQTLSGTLPAVATPGLYRVCVDLAGGNHFTFIRGVAQAVPQYDCHQVTFE